jgi:hypothetical protein
MLRVVMYAAAVLVEYHPISLRDSHKLRNQYIP